VLATCLCEENERAKRERACLCVFEDCGLRNVFVWRGIVFRAGCMYVRVRVRVGV